MTFIASYFVALNATLLKEYDSTLSNREIKNVLIQTAVSLGEKSECVNGVIDIEAAIEYVKKHK